MGGQLDALVSSDIEALVATPLAAPAGVSTLPLGPPPGLDHVIPSPPATSAFPPVAPGLPAPPGLSAGPRGYVDHSPQVKADVASIHAGVECPPLSSQSGKTSPAGGEDLEDQGSDFSTEFTSDRGDDESLGESDDGAAILAIPSQPARALMIFDWDDTLFPTTWIQKHGLMTETVTEQQRDQLDRLTTTILTTLELARSCHGRVVIVTNADAGWVELSMQYFMPGLDAFVREVDVISARALYEPNGITCPFEWKRLCFASLCEAYYGPTNEERNILCIGDSMHEHAALASVTQDMANCSSKSLKFLVRPDLEQLEMQHQKLEECFQRIVCQPGDIRVDF